MSPTLAYVRLPGYTLADAGVNHEEGYDCPGELNWDDPFEYTVGQGLIGGDITCDDDDGDLGDDRAELADQSRHG